MIHAYLKVLWLYIIPFESKASIKPNKKYFTHNKENNIHNTVRASMSQKLLALNITGCVIQHLAERKFGGLRLVTDMTKKNKKFKKLKPRSFNSLALTKKPATFRNNVLREIITRKQD